jgi:DNA-binding NtrC family response regulator
MSKRVLIIDPNPNNRAFMAEALERDGHQVETVDSAEAFFKNLTRLKPQFVVIEVDLVGQSGVSVMRNVARIHGDKVGRILIGATTRRKLIPLADAAHAHVSYSTLEGLDGLSGAVSHLIATQRVAINDDRAAGE